MALSSARLKGICCYRQINKNLSNPSTSSFPLRQLNAVPLAQLTPSLQQTQPAWSTAELGNIKRLLKPQCCWQKGTHIGYIYWAVCGYALQLYKSGEMQTPLCQTSAAGRNGKWEMRPKLAINTKLIWSLHRGMYQQKSIKHACMTSHLKIMM